MPGPCHASLSSWLLPHRLAWLVGAALLLNACQSEKSQPEATRDADADSPSEPKRETIDAAPSLAAPSMAALGRAELLAAFATAADATAARRPLPEAQRDLVGRTFSLALPFGCNGPQRVDAPEWAGWTLARGERTLRLSARPERWGEAEWMRSLAKDMTFEAVEGFWIERPWTASEDCPKPVPVADQAAPADLPPPERPTVGLAQFFARGSPRTFQRGLRPYAHTSRIADEPGAEGVSYRLVVSGRVTGFPDGQPIRCNSEAADRRPVCILAVELARVAFQTAPEGEVLAEWHN